MKQSFWSKKIPSLLGLIIIALGIGVTTLLVNQGGLFSIKASPTQIPKNVRLSNITESSFTVSYQTEDSVSGVVNYGQTTDFGKSSLDDRDQASGNVTNYKLHNLTIRNLSPNTKYYFSIISGKDTYLNSNSPFEITTGGTINDNPPAQNPISGRVLLPSGGAPKESIAYLTSNNSQVTSTLVKSDGSFLLPLNSLRTTNLSSYLQLENSDVLKMLILGDGLTSNIALSVQQISPVPTISLSSNYDFTVTNSPIASSSASQTFPSFESNTKNQGEPSISTPKKDQGFTDQQPQFKGTSAPNQEVQVIIHSDEQIKTSVKSDSNGNWSYRPSAQLSPGTHTITILAKDASGILRTISESFVVYASGNQIPGDKGSPTPTQNPIPTTIPTATSSPSPTQALASPTLEPTSTPTLIEENITTITPTPTEPLPPTGNPLIITAGILGIMLFTVGSALFLSTRRSLI